MLDGAQQEELGGDVWREAEAGEGAGSAAGVKSEALVRSSSTSRGHYGRRNRSSATKRAEHDVEKGAKGGEISGRQHRGAGWSWGAERGDYSGYTEDPNT